MGVLKRLSNGSGQGADRDSGPRFVFYITDTGEIRMLVPILVCGDLYSYTIPSFSVVTVEMRRIKYELLLEDGQPKIIDEFIRDDPSLQRLYPAQLSIEMNPLKATIVGASGKHGKRERERERERERKFGKGRQTHICIYHHRSMLAPLIALS